MTLRLGPGIAFTDDAITETFGILAARGAGKSNTGAVMAEEMHSIGLPFVAIDPVGSWWGLRSSKNGAGTGLKIPLFGGKHGDVPLERTGGTLIADLVVDRRLTCILDLTQFESEAAKKQFLLDFARRLYLKNEEPLHLFLEEADDYIPQRPQKDELKLIRAWENIVRRGRARGLGMTMITQRSASLNKNVLTQVQTLIAMRTTGPQDRKAIEEWIKYNDQSKDILKDLPSLENGEAWIYSPQYLKICKRVKFRQRRTFDSGSTPKMSAKRKTAKLARVDVELLRTKMADTIKHAEENDPKILKQRIQALESEQKKRVKPPPEDQQQLKDAIAERNSMASKLKETIERLDAVAAAVIKSATAISAQTASLVITAEALHGLNAAAAEMGLEPFKLPKPAPTALTVSDAPAGARVSWSPPDGAEGVKDLPTGEMKTLMAIAQHAGGVDRSQLSVLIGYKQSSRNAFVARLKQKGLIESGPPITATTAGMASLPSEFEPLPVGSALREHWYEQLPAGEKTILELLAGVHPSGLSRATLSEATEYKQSSRNAFIARLKQRKLITVSGSDIFASTMLFD